MNSILTRAAAIAACLTTSALLAQSTTPNHIKYRDSGIPNATGRSGTAAIEARALLNRDDTADIELTTGSFEGTSHTGSIERMQLQVGRQTVNFPGDGAPTFSASVDGLARLATVELQANVRGVDGARIDVVSATEVVKLRPDLSVVSVAPPPHALVNFPANVTATIREHNGDTGARANCRLLVDGAEVDRAEGIWVDAGDHVDCRFAYVFDSPGVKSLQVVVDGLNPGDWDDANNSASAELNVYDAALFASWTARAMEEDFVESSYTKNPWHEQTREGAGYNQTLTFAGTINGTFVDLDNLEVTTRVDTDRTTLHDVTDLELDGNISNFFFHCRTANFGLVTGDICQSQWDPDVTNVDLRYAGSRVTYHTWGYNTMLAPSNPGLVYDYVTHSDSNPTRLGNTVAFDVAISDGNAAWHAQPFISSLTTSQSAWANPYRCFYSGFFDGEVCSASSRTATVRAGSVTGR
jgi:hypothetical protein